MNRRGIGYGRKSLGVVAGSVAVVVEGSLAGVGVGSGDAGRSGDGNSETKTYSFGRDAVD